MLISGDHVRKWEAECKTEQSGGLGRSLDQFLEQDERKPEMITNPADKSCVFFFQPPFPHWKVLALCPFLPFLCYLGNEVSITF